MKVRRLWQGLLFTAFAFTGVAANASLILTIDDGVHTPIEVSEPDGNVLSGGTLGTWQFNVMGSTNPSVGTDYIDALNLMSFTAGGGEGTLTVTLTRTEMDKSPANWVAYLGGTTFGSIEFETLLNGTAISHYSATGKDFRYSDSGQIDYVGPYSMSLVATINHDSIYDWSGFNYTVTVPEPSTLALLGSGLLLTGWAAMRRRSAART